MRAGALRYLLLLGALASASCKFLDVREQQEKLAATCFIRGAVTSVRETPGAIVVVLARQRDDGEWTVADHFVLEEAGRWVFAAQPGRYAVAAFDDRSRDLVYQPGEPYATAGFDRPIACRSGANLDAPALAIPAKVRDPFPNRLDIAALQKRSIDLQAERTLGQLTVTGDVIALSDARFSQDNAESGLWRPFDFLQNAWAGIYFLEPYDAKKVPVLFVHGINGTPASFDYLIEHLDRTRFQPWVYYYPSGLRLEAIANHLDETMAKLEVRYGVSRVAVVAHSMGGLVTRGYLLRSAENRRPVSIPLYLTISTPWGGHKSAETGVKRAPVVVRVWRDMAPGSEYQRAMYAQPLPAGTTHHLVFTFNRNSKSFGESGDHSVTVASQLLPQAQLGAVRLYGYDDTHVGVLRDPEVSALLNRLLAASY
ncbi:MAG TPA: alpha/beta hydrolase [Burkholderiales bacterium]|nr:alpha/beta hydrolase [Burkholderiales bacterium]